MTRRPFGSSLSLGAAIASGRGAAGGGGVVERLGERGGGGERQRPPRRQRAASSTCERTSGAHFFATSSWR